MAAILSECTSRLEALEALVGDEANATYAVVATEVEAIGDRLDRAWGMVKHLKSVKDTEPLRKAVDTVQPSIVQFGLRMGQSLPLFAAWKRISDVEGGTGRLSPSQARVVDKEVRDAVLAGVSLTGEAKERFNVIQERLAQLSTKFSNNVLDATKAWTLTLTDKADVAGLPPSALAMAAQAARAENAAATADAGPWKFTLDFPSYMPVMQYSDSRELRLRFYKAYLTRASELSETDASGEKDNGGVIREIVALRQEKAALLGYAHYADVSMSQKMATLDTALALMDDLRVKSMPAALAEHAELQAFAESLGFSGPLQQWDTTYYAEKLKEAKYAFNEEELKPFFSLPIVLDGLFGLARRLFGIECVQLADDELTELGVSIWDKDVRVFSLKRDGVLTAYFYLDPYSRPEEKKGGAWMDSVAGKTSNPKIGKRLPVAHMVCNQSPPVDGKPSLMTFREVETVFHEFGHALQHMLTVEEQGMVAGISGIEWDAVELPSQFMENWCYEKKTLSTIARHYETGAPLPEELYNKLVAAKTYRAASMMVRQLTFAIVDLRIHADAAMSKSHQEWLDEVAQTTSVIPPQPYDRFLNGFSHIFSGGYSAGYFSYKWAEVLSADAFGGFEEAGLDDETKVVALGRKFAATVLGLGGGIDPATVFEMFRGRPPSADALIRHAGLASAA